MSKAAFKRVLLKISGEGLCASGGFGIDGNQLRIIADQIREVYELGIELCIVVGGGNIVRGSELARNAPIEETTSHYMGMLATVINALAVQDTLESIGIDTRVQSALAVDRVCEKFIRRRAIRHLEKRRVVIFAAGTGNPFVTTDTGAGLRASEVGAEVFLKATQVDAVYSDDPNRNPDAERLERLSYKEVIDRRLAVMDLSAVDLCQRNSIPIIVFDLHKPGNMRSVCQGEPIGTLIADPDWTRPQKRI